MAETWAMYNGSTINFSDIPVHALANEDAFVAYYTARMTYVYPSQCAIIDDIALDPEIPEYLRVEEGL